MKAKAKVRTLHLRPSYNYCYNCVYFNREIDWCILWGITARKSGKACKKFGKKDATNIKK